VEAHEEQNELVMEEDFLSEDAKDPLECIHLLDECEVLEGEDTEHLTLSSLGRVSDDDSYATDGSIPYGHYGLENSLTIYLRDSCQCPLLTKEDEVYLFARIERGRRMVSGAISGTRLGPDLSWDDVDRIVAEVRAIARDIEFLENVINCANSGEKLTDFQIAKLMQTAEKRSCDSSPALAIHTHIFSHDRTDAIAEALLKELQKDLGVTKGDLAALLGRINDGKGLISSARERIIEANLRLVVSIAKRYVAANPALSESDLVQEGNIGLMYAVDRFQYQMGYRCSTYAYWWIRQSISRAISSCGRTIRLPIHVIQSSRIMGRASERSEQELNRSPTIEDIADQMQVPSEKLEEIRQTPRCTVSLDKSVGPGSDSPLVNLLEDRNIRLPEDEVVQDQVSEKIDEVLSRLSEREEQVIRLRFGIDDDDPHTLNRIGRKLGVSRERVRQIERRALGKLRHPAKTCLLSDFA